MLAFLNLDFVYRLLWMFFQAIVNALLGGLVGTLIAVLIKNTGWLMLSARRFARLGIWFPFFVIAALPQSSPQIFSVIMASGIIAVSAFSFYEVLVVQTIRQFRLSEAILLVGRKILLQSLLFSFYSQIHERFGWIVLSFQKPEFAYAAFVLTAILLMLLDRVCDFRFDQTSDLDCKSLVDELFSYKIGSFIGTFLLCIACVGCWQLSSKYILHYLLVDSPVVVSLTAYKTLSSGVTTGPEWEVGHVLTSLVETFGGLVTGGAFALVARECMNKNTTVRQVIDNLLPMTYITPLILMIPINNWLSSYTAPWRTALTVALLAFYPFVKVLWGLRGAAPPFAFLLGAEQALPFAFIGMLYGEQWGATRGLGFLATVSRAEMRTNEALAVSLLTFGLFVALSASLRFASKKLRH